MRKFRCKYVYNYFSVTIWDIFVNDFEEYLLSVKLYSYGVRYDSVTIKESKIVRIQFEGLGQSRINQRVANPCSDTPDTYNPTSDRGNMTVSSAVQQPSAIRLFTSNHLILDKCLNMFMPVTHYPCALS